MGEAPPPAKVDPGGGGFPGRQGEANIPALPSAKATSVAQRSAGASPPPGPLGGGTSAVLRSAMQAQLPAVCPWTGRLWGPCSGLTKRQSNEASLQLMGGPEFKVTEQGVMTRNGETTAPSAPTPGDPGTWEQTAQRKARQNGRNPPDLSEWRVFAPRIDDSGASYAALRDAVAHGGDAAVHALASIARHVRGDGIIAQRIRAAALVLRDLAAMGWALKADKTWIYIRPAITEADASKDPIRRQLEFARDDQLRDPATRRFLVSLERPTRFSSVLPVTDLIADGRRLLQQLAPLAQMRREERVVPLGDV